MSALRLFPTVPGILQVPTRVAYDRTDYPATLTGAAPASYGHYGLELGYGVGLTSAYALDTGANAVPLLVETTGGTRADV